MTLNVTVPLVVTIERNLQYIRLFSFSLPKDCTQYTDILIQIFNEFAGKKIKKNIEQAKIHLIYYLQTKPQQ